MILLSIANNRLTGQSEDTSDSFHSERILQDVRLDLSGRLSEDKLFIGSNGIMVKSTFHADTERQAICSRTSQ